MSAQSSPSLCPTCGAPVSGSAAAVFCAQCGTRLLAVGAATRLWLALRLIPPLLTFFGSLIAWVKVSPAGNQGWNVYHFGSAGWGWLAGDVVALAVVVLALVRPQIPPGWLWTAWNIYGGLSLGMALSGLVFVRMGTTIAGLVNAPNPLVLASGVFVFGLGCLLWLALSFTPHTFTKR